MNNIITFITQMPHFLSLFLSKYVFYRPKSLKKSVLQSQVCKYIPNWEPYINPKFFKPSSIPNKNTPEVWTIYHNVPSISFDVFPNPNVINWNIQTSTKHNKSIQIRTEYKFLIQIFVTNGHSLVEEFVCLQQDPLLQIYWANPLELSWKY